LNERIIRAAGLADLVAPGGALITGAPRRSAPDAGPRHVWNSMHVIDRRGVIHDTYDKFHLVPFGEYVPFRTILPVAKITAGRSDFSVGPGRTSLAIPGAPRASPLICYEAIFSGRVLPPERPGEPRPGWLLNLTNDAWFGMSVGPFQHFANVRLRAVEEGLPLVRVANTGISAVIDAYGRIKAIGPLGRAATIDAALPAALGEKTLFARFGFWAGAALMFIFWIIAWRLSLYSVSSDPT
jgi:apolipoprotein N-acyltransferase